MLFALFLHENLHLLKGNYMKTLDDREDDMLEDYSHVSFDRAKGRFANYKDAPVFIIDRDGVRRQRTSLLVLEEELSKYALSDFELIVEALKVIAGNRGAENVQYILEHCERELSELKPII